MKIADIITQKSVLTKIKAQNKRALLQDLAAIAAKQTGLEERIIFDSLLERENLGSTGFGNGTAIPHTRISNLSQVFVLFASLDTAVDFASIDGKPVDLIFLLLSPENNGADHLTALAGVSRILKNDEMCKKLRKIDAPLEVFSLLKNCDVC